jgi:hypothetical protein
VAAAEPTRTRVLAALALLAVATVAAFAGVIALALGERPALGLLAVPAVAVGLVVGLALRGELRPGGRGGGLWVWFLAAIASSALAKAPDVVQLAGLGAVAGFLAVCTVVVAQRQL